MSFIDIKRRILLGFIQPHFSIICPSLYPLPFKPILPHLGLPLPGLYAVHLEQRKSVAFIGFLSP